MRSFPLSATVLFTVTLLLAGCSGAPTTDPPRQGTSIVLAEMATPASLNPLAGYAPNGAAEIFDGLYEHQPDGTLRPTLAAGDPQPSADGRSWTVVLRTGVKFSDGSPFGAEDVVATYHALLNPVTASPLRPRYSVITDVRQIDPMTVRFDLGSTYPAFPNLLVLGILPRAALAKPVPVGKLPVDSHPIGTGPYVLRQWQPGKKAVLTSNPSYMDGEPKIKTVTVLFGQGDEERAREVREDRVDGTALPAGMLRTWTKTDPYRTITDHSAEFRAVRLPMRGPVTGDRAVRQALNYAVDRKAMVDSVLAGAGSAASTPVTDVLPEFLEPSAGYSLDQAKARELLDQAGWMPGADGQRTRGRTAATFPLDYAEDDITARDLASAFTRDAKTIGITVTPRAVALGDLPAKAATDAEMISAGNPFDPDLTLFPLLHSGGADNPTSYSDSAVDTALNTARQQLDPGQRAVAYRQLQRAYLRNPAMVVLVRMDHLYLQRDGWKGYQTVTDAAASGMTWGPWWNLHQWSPP